MDERECDHCEEWFEFGLDQIYTSSEIIDGQYTELAAIKCPKCGEEMVFMLKGFFNTELPKDNFDQVSSW